MMNCEKCKENIYNLFNRKEENKSNIEKFQNMFNNNFMDIIFFILIGIFIIFILDSFVRLGKYFK
jgi:hypothetical protein